MSAPTPDGLIVDEDGNCVPEPTEEPEPEVILCVVSEGVTQTATTVTGTSGDDSLDGPSNDSSVDTLSGGLGTDVCSGPGPDGDIVTECEL